MAKINLSGAQGKFYCPGCKQYHVFTITGTNFNGDIVNPTLASSLVYANAGIVTCTCGITAGRITYRMESRHALAGQTVDLPDMTTGGLPK